MSQFENWAAERDRWDQETGAPGISLFGNALQVWSFMQEGKTSVAEAAITFMVSPERIIEAVEEHAWMFLEGDRADPAKLFIEHEGE